ncbi:MAG: hypothetical protein AB7K36_06930 [Chloroflexota bacterium]
MASGSLPQTVAARRNARLRALAFAIMPLLLYVLAAGVRVWEPDLVQFGLRQAAYVDDAARRAPVGWLIAYADPSVTPLMLADPLLRHVPAPLPTWVVLRGLLDSFGAAFLYLAARPLVGRGGATLAALLYALSPTFWAAARDPAGPLTAVLMTAALWRAVRLVHRPVPARAVAFGLILGLLARSLWPPLLVVGLGAATLAIGRASWRIGGIAALCLVLAAGPALFGDHGAEASMPVGLTASTFPEWLLTSLVYRPPDGLAAGTWFLPWDGRGTILLVGLCAAVGAGTAIWLARQGHPRLLLPVAWAALAIGSAAVAFAWRWQTTSPSSLPPATLQGDATLTLAMCPLLSVLILMPLVLRRRALRLYGIVVGLVVLVLSAASLVLSMNGIEAAAAAGQVLVQQSTSPLRWPHSGAVVAEAGSGMPGTQAHLRAWLALSSAVGEAAARTESDDVVVVGESVQRTFAVTPLRVLLRNSVRVRSVPAALVLPLARETVYLVTANAQPPVELQRASSSMGVYTSSGVDTGVTIRTLRPRPARDWLARTRAVPGGRFVDGSVLAGLVHDVAQDGRVTLTLYWELPPVADGRDIGVGVRIGRPGDVALSEAALPSVDVRRGQELVVQTLSLTDRSGPPDQAALSLTLVNAAGQPVSLSSGAEVLELPITAP